MPQRLCMAAVMPEPAGGDPRAFDRSKSLLPRMQLGLGYGFSVFFVVQQATV